MPKAKIPTLCITFDNETEMVDFALEAGLKITGHANFAAYNRPRSYWNADTDTDAHIDRNGAYAITKLPYPSIVNDMLAGRVKATELDAT